jgi:hypothetical protein
MTNSSGDNFSEVNVSERPLTNMKHFINDTLAKQLEGFISSDLNHEDVKARLDLALSGMKDQSVIAGYSSRIIRETPDEMTVREVMEEPNKMVTLEYELNLITPMKYVSMTFKLDR